MSKRPSPTKASAMIVEFLLDYVEHAGRLTGPRNQRVLQLPGGVVTLGTGKITPHVERMRADVVKILRGEATYPSNVGRAHQAGAARDPQDASGPLVAPAPEPRPHGNATP